MRRETFLRRIADALRALGFDAKYEGGYLYVGECQFDAYANYRGNIRFLGSSFKINADGDFNIGRAVRLLVDHMPYALGRVEAIKAEAARRKTREEYELMAASLTERLHSVAVCDGVRSTADNDGVLITVRVTDKDTAQKVISAARRLIGQDVARQDVADMCKVFAQGDMLPEIFADYLDDMDLAGHAEYLRENLSCNRQEFVLRIVKRYQL